MFRTIMIVLDIIAICAIVGIGFNIRRAIKKEDWEFLAQQIGLGILILLFLIFI